jgi:hypothetical protein
MDVCLLWMLCVVRLRSLRRADLSSRGVLPTVVCRCAWSRNLGYEEALAHWGLSRQKQKQKTNKQLFIQGGAKVTWSWRQQVKWCQVACAPQCIKLRQFKQYCRNSETNSRNRTYKIIDVTYTENLSNKFQHTSRTTARTTGIQRRDNWHIKIYYNKTNTKARNI